jgi:hypothetical protein
MADNGAHPTELEAVTSELPSHPQAPESTRLLPTLLRMFVHLCVSLCLFSLSFVFFFII